jgi:hypothetical protein
VTASSPVSIPLEAKPKLEDVVAELAPESMSPGTLPLTIHNLETNVLHERVGEQALYMNAHRCIDHTYLVRWSRLEL